MTLILDNLRDVVRALGEAIDFADVSKGLSPTGKVVVQAGVIQHFEFTYELCWKFMKRYLEANLGSVYVDGVSRRELFRLAAEHRLIDDVDLWMDFHAARNRTSHVYSRAVADEVFDESVRFLPESRKLLKALEARND